MATTCFGPQVAIIRYTVQILEEASTFTLSFSFFYCVPDDGHQWAETCSSHILMIIIIFKKFDWKID
jgi:hypothetical protein